MSKTEESLGLKFYGYFQGRIVSAVLRIWLLRGSGSGWVFSASSYLRDFQNVEFQWKLSERCTKYVPL